MASLRNLAIGILHAHGDRNIAAGLRRNARDATRVLPLPGITSPSTRHSGTMPRPWGNPSLAPPTQVNLARTDRPTRANPLEGHFL
jgi:hypothetical protein